MAGRRDFEYYEAEYCYKDYERGLSEEKMEDYYESLTEDEKEAWILRQLYGMKEDRSGAEKEN